MNTKLLDRLCLGVCILCIIVGVVMTLGMLWTDGISSPFTWKLLATNGVIFMAAAATLSVSRTFGGRQ